MYLTSKLSAWEIFYLKSRQANTLLEDIYIFKHEQDYATAKNLCYQWYLLHCITVNYDGCNVKEKYFNDGFHINGNVNAAVLTVSIH